MSVLKEWREGAAKIASRANSAAFTVYTTDPGDVLSKSYALEDGKLVKAASGGVMTAASATVQAVSNLTELSDVLEGLGPQNAISWGVPRPETGVQPGDEFRVVTAARAPESGAVGRRAMIARTRERFAYPDGEAGIFMIDIDDPAPGKPTPATPEEVADLLRDAVPELEDVELLIVPSGSACIHDAETGAELRGTTGWRAYIMVDDAATIPQLGQLLFDALWLVGEGYVKLSASGAKLVRAAVDAAVWQPERLDFVGGAQLGEGLEQRRPAPALIPPADGRKAKARLDVTKVAPLTEKESAEVERLRTEAMAACEEEAAERRAESVRRQVDRHVAEVEEREKRAVPPAEKAGIEARVRERLERRADTLYADQLLDVLHGGSWVTVSVGEIVVAGERYIGCRARDPYDPSDLADRPDGDGTILRPGDRAFVFHSHAHGQNTTFRLVDHHEGENVIALKVAQLYEKLCEKKGKDVVDTRIAAAEERRQAAEEEKQGNLLELLDDWVEANWRDLVPEGVDYEARAADWLNEMDFDPKKVGPKKLRMVARGMVGLEELNAMVLHLACRYCFVSGATRDGEEVYDLLTGTSTSVRQLEKHHKRLKAQVPRPTPGGNDISLTTRNAVDAWLESDERVTISKYDFTPGSTQLFTEGLTKDTVGINIYRPRKYAAPPMDPDEAGRLFTRFLAHLVPNEREAAFLLNHVTGVVQRPELRGQAVMGVSARGGAGRGTFHQIIRLLVHERFSRSLKMSALYGEAARFNEWEEHAVVVTIDEMGALGGDKYKAASEIDDRFETEATWKSVEEKGKSRRTVKVHWTFFGSAMSLDAIALEKRDRRWTILTNTDKRFADVPEVLDVVTAMQEFPRGPIDEGFAHGLWLWLRAREFDADMFMAGIMTDAKRRLLEASEGDIELALRHVLKELVEQEKFEVWVSNAALATASRMKNAMKSSDAAVRKAWTKVPELLKVGFEGWFIPTNAKGVPEAPRIRLPAGSRENDLRPQGRIARHDDAPKYTPEERYEIVGEERQRRG